jgi:short subunit dehydrogenase-like uncharacterized protein
MKLVGRRGEHRLTYQVGDDRDPGYGSTCKMLGQSALCLAFDAIPNASAAAKGGCLTPSIAMGEALLRRLRDNGLTFEVVESR